MHTPLTPRPRRRSTFRPAETDVFSRYARIRRRSSRAIAFIEGECIVPSGRNAGKRYRLLPYQKADLRAILDSGCLVAIVSGPRGFGKTGIVAALLVWALYDREGAQVIAASTAMRTAKQGYGRAVRIIETNPRLAEQAQVYRNSADPYVELPGRGAVMYPLPATEAFTVGQAPTLVVVDEVGYVSHATYEAMQTSLGKDEDTLLLGVGTPGLSAIDETGENLMYGLRTKALSDSPPPDLVYIEHAARPGADPADKRSWKRANPGLGILVEPRAVALDYATMPASRFAQMRLGLWSQHESALLPVEVWDALEVIPGPIEAGSLIMLGFDGSVSRDSTALWAYEHASGRLCQLGFWSRPPGAKTWKVPRAEVVATIDAAFERYEVGLMLGDPWYWRSELEALAERHGEDRVMQWNTAAPSRMAPATDAFVAAIMKGEVSTDGSETLRAHALSAVAKNTAAGSVIVKDARKPQQIDAFIAALLAHEASRTYVEPVASFLY